LGEIENLPVADNIADMIISNGNSEVMMEMVRELEMAIAGIKVHAIK